MSVTLYKQLFGTLNLAHWSVLSASGYKELEVPEAVPIAKRALYNVVHYESSRKTILSMACILFIFLYLFSVGLVLSFVPLKPA